MSTPFVERDRPTNADQVGSIPTASAANGVTINGEYGQGVVRTTTFTLTGSVITFADNGGTGSGSLQLLDFPAGLIEIVGAVTDLDYTLAGFTDAGLLSSLGTTAANADGDLSDSGEGNIIASTATAIANTGTFNAVSALTSKVQLDGTSTARDLFLNLASPNDPVGNKSIAVSGKVQVTWINHGTIPL